MLPLKDFLIALKKLKDLVDEYIPIMYQSTDRGKVLSEEIPQVYGGVQELYRAYIGNLNVEVENFGKNNYYSNYFEAGFLSGRSFHTHQGTQELLKVMGQVQKELESGHEKLSTHHLGVKNMNVAEKSHDKKSLKEKYENNPIIFCLGLITLGFISGAGFSEWTYNFRNSSEVSQTNLSPIAVQIELLTAAHNKRLTEFQNELRENEQGAVYNGNTDSRQQTYVNAAERIRASIKEENESYAKHLEQLMKIVGANGT
ncbi:hypothetical protein ACWIJ6_06360 [Aeromonas piscicola]